MANHQNRRWWMTVVLAVATVGLLGCGGGEVSADFAESYDLPAGLVQAPHTTAVGRPAQFSRAFDDNDLTEEADSLLAVYRVDEQHAEAAISHWNDQLAHCAEYADVVLQSSKAGPFMTVSASGLTTACDLDSEVFNSERPPAAEGSADRGPGEHLFTQQGDEMHVPTGARTLTPELVNNLCTGSLTVLAARDGPAVIGELTGSAAKLRSAGLVQGPRRDAALDADVLTAQFAIYAGGWSFDVVSVRGPADPAATVYITDCGG